jgi:hypothetical protein
MKNKITAIMFYRDSFPRENTDGTFVKFCRGDTHKNYRLTWHNEGRFYKFTDRVPTKAFAFERALVVVYEIK